MRTIVGSDLVGRTCLVTGASTGVGRAAAEQLARLGARVVLAVRDAKRGEDALGAIRVAKKRDVEMAAVDLASRTSIRAFARDLAARHSKLDVLVNNAGIWSESRRLSPDGVELVWATNVLGYFLVTDLLLPLLEAAGAARIVNVASRLAGDLDLGDVEFQRRPYRADTAYSQSKQADRMLTWALARRLEGSGVSANAMSPGPVATDLVRKGGRRAGRVASLLARLRARTPRRGADTVVWLAASPEVRGRSGGFWFDRQEIPCAFRDEAGEEALWALCRDMTAG
jgi:NAD(P)-dependent dehydrogenase (short-subunit alcohol dehydrogenase family)